MKGRSGPPLVATAYRGGLDGDARAGWWIGFAYDRETVERLKRAIPHTDRSYDATRRLWWIAIDQAGTVRELLPSFAQFEQQGQLEL